MSFVRKARYIGEFDLWKLLFAFLIASLHSGYLPTNTENAYFQGGSIGVEFFFLVSGFFLAKSSLHCNEYSSLPDETWHYVVRKFKGLYPYMLFGFCISLIAKTLFYRQDLIQFIKNCANGTIELLFLKSAGIGDTFFNTPTWYLSALFLSIMIAYPLLRKYKHTFSLIFAPAIALFILGYLFQTYGNFRSPDTWCGIFNKGFLRGFSEILIGIFCYEISSKLSQVHFTFLSKLIFTIIEYAGLISIILYSNTKSYWDMDCPSLIFMAFAIIIMGSNNSIFSTFWNNLPITPFLGKFSLLFYLNHIYWIWIFDIIGFQMEYSKMFCLFFLCSICSAIACWVTVDTLKRFFLRWKKLFIVTL